MRRVLISHSWNHPASQARLTDLLKRHSYEYFDHSITIDAPLQAFSREQLLAQLANRISQVSAVVVLCTEDAHKRETLGFEMKEAIRQGKRLVAVKPWGEGTAPIPRLIESHADAIVGFRGDQIIPAIEGANTRNLADYRIAEDEDVRSLAHWITRAAAGAILVGALTAKTWLPRLNHALASMGFQVVWDGPSSVSGELIKNGAIGAAVGFFISALLDGDDDLAVTLTGAGAALGVGTTLLKRLSLRITETPQGFTAQYLPLPR